MNTQDRLFEDLSDKSLFEQSLAHGLAYVEQALDRHLDPRAQDLLLLEHFKEALPIEGVAAKTILQQLHDYGAPNTLPMLGGRYFGFVNGSAVPAGLAAKQLATFWDQNTAMYVLSPVVSTLETVVQEWLKTIFQLPKRSVAGFVSGTSMANFTALAAARYRLLQRQNWDVNEHGLFHAPPIRVVTGKHAHSTVLKAVALLGFGKANIEWVDVDEQGRIRVDHLPELDDRTLLILQAGDVNSGAFDDFETIIEQANAANAWVHVDGAFGLWAAASPQLRHLTKGIERANSWATDGHKTLNTPYDSGIVMCEDEEALVAALHMNAGYLVLSKERDNMFYTPEMSRRARVVELWATMKNLGVRGIGELVENLHQRAVQFATHLQQIDGFCVLNEVVFNQVIVQCENDELTDQCIQAIQQERVCWVGGSTWFGKRIIRVSVCAWTCTATDIERTLASFERALEQVRK